MGLLSLTPPDLSIPVNFHLSDVESSPVPHILPEISGQALLFSHHLRNLKTAFQNRTPCFLRNNPEFPEDIRQVATSALLETGKPFRRSEIIAGVMAWFEKYYNTFLQTSDLSLLKEEYNSLMINTNRKVLVIRPDEQYEAIARSIDDDGELIIERDGVRAKVLSGEVSVRGVYGYV